MARENLDYAQAGARIAAISVDPPAVNAALVEKLVLPFTVLADPDGEGAIKPNGLWNAESRISKPAILVLTPDGREVYRYVGADFVDRPDDGDIPNALTGLALPPLTAGQGPIEHLEPQPSSRAFRIEDLGPYLRGVRSGTQALSERLQDEKDREEARRTAAMAERYLKAHVATRALLR